MPNPNDTNPTGLRRTTSTTGQEPDSASAGAPTDTGPSSRRSSMSDERNPNNTGASTRNEQLVQQARDLRQYLTGGAGAAAAEGINEILNNEAAHPKDLTAENKRHIEALTKYTPTWGEIIEQTQRNPKPSQHDTTWYPETTKFDPNDTESGCSLEEYRRFVREIEEPEKRKELQRYGSNFTTEDVSTHPYTTFSQSTSGSGNNGANEAEQEVDSTIKPGRPGSSSNSQQ